MTQLDSTQPTPCRVLVVDPDDRIRESLSRLIRIGGRCLVVGTTGDAAEAIALTRSIGPDVVMVDYRLTIEEADGRFVDALRSAAPATRIIVLNWSDSAGPSETSSRADAYIRKTFRPHELIDAVINAARTSLA
jgi:two-component system, OmpR family, response regulator MprA